MADQRKADSQEVFAKSLLQQLGHPIDSTSRSPSDQQRDLWQQMGSVYHQLHSKDNSSF